MSPEHSANSSERSAMSPELSGMFAELAGMFAEPAGTLAEPAGMLTEPLRKEKANSFFTQLKLQLSIAYKSNDVKVYEFVQHTASSPPKHTLEP